MKFITPFVFILFSLSLVLAEDMKLDTLTTTEGKTYNNVTVSKVTPSELRIIHEAGAASIPFTKLTEETQKQFNYDEAKDLEYRKRLKDSANRARKSNAQKVTRNRDDDPFSKPQKATRTPPARITASDQQAGFEAFYTKGVGQSGELKSRKGKAYKYKRGPFKNLTKKEGEVKARNLWNNMSLASRIQYINKARGYDVTRSRDSKDHSDIRSDRELARGLGAVRHSAISNKEYQEGHREEIIREQANGWRQGDEVLIDLSKQPIPKSEPDVLPIIPRHETKTISSISENGAKIVCTDGTVYNVSEAERPNVMSWLPASTIAIKNGQLIYLGPGR